LYIDDSWRNGDTGLKITRVISIGANEGIIRSSSQMVIYILQNGMNKTQRRVDLLCSQFKAICFLMDILLLQDVFFIRIECTGGAFVRHSKLTSDGAFTVAEDGYPSFR
jgi:hypothetical protein